MSIACVIGNGPSRKSLDLKKINESMITFGCNALYRDFLPDYLVSMDYNMVDEILQNNIHHVVKFYTQHTNKYDELAEVEPIYFVKIQKETNDSGNTALRLALDKGHDIVYVIGFDYDTDPSHLPNVYHHTKNYVNGHVWPAATMQATKWLQRLNTIARQYPNQRIIRVNGTKKLNVMVDNYSEISLEQFKEIYE